MTLIQALILGLIQGVGELFPVSSLGQTILLPAVLGWNVHAGDADFLAFLVALHLATAVALLIYFWKDWKLVVLGYVSTFTGKKLVPEREIKFAWLLVAGTVIVGAIGFAFEKKFRAFFEDPRYYWLVALILILNGAFMILGDFLKARTSKQKEADSNPPQRREAEDMSMQEGALVGAAQTFALFPGISRSGVTIVAGLLAGLSYEAASRFSFMLATPVIGLAAVLKVPGLLKNKEALQLAAPAALVSGVTAYLSVAFLMRYFKHNRLSPFGYYCILSGAAAWAILAHRG